MEELLKSSDENKKERPPLTPLGKTLIGVFAASFVGVAALAVPFLLPAARKHCLPYVPATAEQLVNVRRLLSKGGAAAKNGGLVDLGSGDGRIVIDCSRAGYQRCEGVELNPWLVLKSRYHAWSSGEPVTFRTKDLWKMDLSKYENIVIFGVPSMMPRLEDKLKNELCLNGQVVACRFSLPTATPSEKIEAGVDTTWRYTRQCLDAVNGIGSKSGTR